MPVAPDPCRYGQGRQSKPEQTAGRASERICAWCYYLQSWTGSVDPGGAERRSFHHHRMFVFGRRWGSPQQQNERNGGKSKNPPHFEIPDVACKGSLRV